MTQYTANPKTHPNTVRPNDWRRRANRFRRGGIRSVDIARVETTPANIVYGAEFYTRIVKI